MSDVQQLKDAVNEFDKAAKELDDKLNTAVEETRQLRQEQTEQSSRQS